VFSSTTDFLQPVGAVVLENTHRSAGGRVWPLDEFESVASTARELGLVVHLDGARLFNAAVAAGVSPSSWARHADSVTICFSKGLGCPLGAIVAGSSDFIERAWEGKFLFGGALRQAGVVAAAMLYALDVVVERIESEAEAQARLGEHGVLVGVLRPGVLRAATHLDVADEDVDRAIELIPQGLGALARA
jgi:threonine aldolase